MFGIGIQELIVVLIIVLVLFGGKNIPELSRSLGQAIKELRKGFSDPVTDKKENEKSNASKSSEDK